MAFLSKVNREGNRFRLEVALHGLSVPKTSSLINKQLVFGLVRRNKFVDSKTYLLNSNELELNERLVMLITLFKDPKRDNFAKKKYSIEVKEVGAKKAELFFEFNASEYAKEEDFSVELKGRAGSKLIATISCPLEANYRRPESDMSSQDIPDIFELSDFDLSSCENVSTFSNEESDNQSFSSSQDSQLKKQQQLPKYYDSDDRGKEMTMYPSVFASLGFKGAGNGHYYDIHPGSSDVESISLLQQEVEQMKQDLQLLKQQKQLAEFTINSAVNQMLILLGSSPDYQGSDPMVLQTGILKVANKVQKLETQISRQTTIDDSSAFSPALPRKLKVSNEKEAKLISELASLIYTPGKESSHILTTAMMLLSSQSSQISSQNSIDRKETLNPILTNIFSTPTESPYANIPQSGTGGLQGIDSLPNTPIRREQYVNGRPN